MSPTLIGYSVIVDHRHQLGVARELRHLERRHEVGHVEDLVERVLEAALERAQSFFGRRAAEKPPTIGDTGWISRPPIVAIRSFPTRFNRGPRSTCGLKPFCAISIA